MKQDRLKEYDGYGYTTIGETENDETIVVKWFESGVVMIMAVHEKYTSQLRLEKEHLGKIIELYGFPQVINSTESPSTAGTAAEGEVFGNDCRNDSCS